jgi:hypothetical protein
MSAFGCLGICLIAALVPAANTKITFDAKQLPLSAACSAFKDHVGGLLNEHRFAGEISKDEFGTLIGQFYDAQTSCDAGRNTEGLDLYSRIAVRPPRTVVRPIRSPAPGAFERAPVFQKSCENLDLC